MFFPACASLANKHADLRGLIEVLDGRLAKSSPTATFQPAIVAQLLRVDVDAALDILKALTPEVLIAATVLRCTHCETLNDDVDNSTGSVECSQCQWQIPVTTENLAEVFRFSPQARRLVETARMQPKDASSQPSLAAPASQPKRQLVVLMHGIRTSAQWQGRLRRLLERPELTQVEPIKVGFVDVFTFLLPLVRRLPIKEARKKLHRAQEFLGDREFVIVAHSFGTYSLVKILEEFPGIRPDRIIFCGAVLPLNYEWARLRQQPTVLNDFGTKDFLPALATFASWGYGPSGTFGFGCPGIRDRAHALGHSDFFTDDFISKFWVPFVHEGRIVESEHDSNAPTAGWCINVLSWGPLKYVCLATAVGVYFYWPQLVSSFSWIRSFV